MDEREASEARPRRRDRLQVVVTHVERGRARGRVRREELEGERDVRERGEALEKWEDVRKADGFVFFY